MNYLTAEMNIFESTSIVHDEAEEAQQLQQQQQQLNEQVYVSLRSMHALNTRQSDEQLTQILQSRMQANSQIMDDMRTRHASNKVNNNNNNHNDNTTTIITEQSSQYSNIPFVQIHTTDVRPQHNNYGNSFRRPATNAETIKSEPIKSETSEGIIKENNNTNNNNHNNNNNNNNNNSSNSNVPLTKTTNNDNENGIEKISKNVSLEDENSNCVGTSQKTPRVFKCTKCHLLTLTQRDLAFHMQHAHTDHGIPRRLVACPGCENKFFSLAVLELHFREDHLMSEPDVLILMNGVDFLESEDEDDLFEQFENNEQPVEMIADKNANALESQSKEMSVPTTAETIAVENHNVEQQQQQQHQNQTKSRIYLRNVECLREPRALREQQVEAATSHQPEFLDNFFPTHTPIDFDVLTFSNSEFLTSENIDINVDLTKIDNRNINNKNKIHDSNIIKSLPIVDVERKQKISIKSVELLCKPDMLENNYGGNFINKPPVSAVNTETFDDLLLPTQAATTTVPTVMCELEPARPARPKIYIKNVDILKEPFLSPEFFKPTLSNLPSMNFNFLSTPTNTTNCEDTLNPLNNFLTPTVPTINNLNSFMPDNLYTHLVDMEEPNLHTIVTEQQTTVSHSQQEDENSLLENNILSESDLLLPMLNDHLYEQPDQAQPTEYSTFNGGTSSRQKIFIKNVEVLKEPQMQEPRGTLHLRTVDELNLMNKREVENLIAPNLEQNYEQSEPDHNFLNNSEIEDEIAHHMNNSNDSTISIDLLLNRTGSWTQGIECDLPDNNECFTTISSSAEMEHERVKSSTPLSMEMSANNSNKFNGFPSNTDVLHEGAISLRAIDELTDVPHDVPQDVPTSCDAFMFQESAEGNDLYELATAEVMPDVMLSNNKPKNAAVLETTHNLPPPLVPMSNNSILTVAESTTNRNVPLVALPPLVPVSNSVRLTTIHQNQAKEIKENSNVENNGVFLKSVRGRPYGPKKPLGTPTTKAKPATKSNKKQHLDTREKCSVKGCRYRFSKQETLMYHQRCHTSDGKNERLICPECGFSCKTWNALHTHLWRLHDIDMELYFCKICSFKTPIYSRLANIHMKIHSDERGYKCEQCDKAFKNSKQLKNHRRWHRLHPNKPHSSTTTATENQTTNLHDCNDGMQAFPTELALSMHNCKQKVPLKCKKCDLTFLSHHLLKMHALVHDESDQKRLQCNQCEFNCTDYNSLRRHKMRHNQTKKYNCPHCTAKFIQSCSFQKHIKQKHAEHMSTTLCICNFCPFTTISMSLYRTHMAKHNADDEAINIEVSPENARGVSS